MKPRLNAVVFSAALLCAVHPIAAQSPTGIVALGREPWPAPATEWNAATQVPWAAAPLEPSLPYGYFWQDYRGSVIEHHLYDPAPHVSIHRPTPARGLADAICGLFEKITSPLCPSWRCSSNSKACCNCVGTAPQNYPSPYLALPQPMVESGQTPLDAGLPPIPTPIPSPALPPIPLPRAVATPNSTPLAPLAAPPPLPLNPAIEDTALPLPSEPERPEGSSIVELAPDFVLPPEPAPPAAPRNRIPTVPASPPRNVIPAN